MHLSFKKRTRANIHQGTVQEVCACLPRETQENLKRYLVHHLVPRTMELLIGEQPLCNLASRSDHSEATVEELLILPFQQQFRIVNWLDAKRVVTQVPRYKTFLEC